MATNRSHMPILVAMLFFILLPSSQSQCTYYSTDPITIEQDKVIGSIEINDIIEISFDLTINSPCNETCHFFAIGDGLPSWLLLKTISGDKSISMQNWQNIGARDFGVSNVVSLINDGSPHSLFFKLSPNKKIIEIDGTRYLDVNAAGSYSHSNYIGNIENITTVWVNPSPYQHFYDGVIENLCILSTSPTSSPTKDPTAAPTQATRNPSTQPTLSPSMYPSVSPTSVSDKPSMTPTMTSTPSTSPPSSFSKQTEGAVAESTLAKSLSNTHIAQSSNTNKQHLYIVIGASAGALCICVVCIIYVRKRKANDDVINSIRNVSDSIKLSSASDNRAPVAADILNRERPISEIQQHVVITPGQQELSVSDNMNIIYKERCISEIQQHVVITPDPVKDNDNDSEGPRDYHVSQSTETNMVKHWLDLTVGLSQYYDLLMRYEYDTLDILKEIGSGEQLIAIGITDSGHQSIFLREINKLKLESNNDIDAPASFNKDNIIESSCTDIAQHVVITDH